MRKWPFKESSVQYGIVGVERSGFGDENVTSMTRRQNHWGPVLRLPSLRAPVVLTPLTEAWMNQKKWDAASEKKWSASEPLRYGLTHRLCLSHTHKYTNAHVLYMHIYLLFISGTYCPLCSTEFMRQIKVTARRSHVTRPNMYGSS